MPAVAAVLKVTDHCGISYRITVIIRWRTRLFASSSTGASDGRSHKTVSKPAKSNGPPSAGYILTHNM